MSIRKPSWDEESQAYNGRRCKLREIPSEVFTKYQKVRVIYLSYNFIKEIPNDIRLFCNLEVLNLSNNRLTSLPDCIGELTTLILLYLDGNTLISLPNALVNLINLESFWCDAIPGLLDRQVRIGCSERGRSGVRRLWEELFGVPREETPTNVTEIPLLEAPISAKDLQPEAKEGFLEKKKQDGMFGLPGWQRRWCVIKDNMFYYYKKPSDEKHLKAISLEGYDAAPAPHAVEHKKKKNICFELVHPEKRCYQFLASNKDDMEDWINCVTKASGKSDEPGLKNKNDLLNELRDLKDQKCCKICMDHDICMLFQPCGHMVTCQECAQTLKKCPVCRKSISTAIRAFMA